MTHSVPCRFALVVLLGGPLIATAEAQDRVVVVARPDTAAANEHYAGNRPPLLPSPLIKLPTGSITPRGWLRKQLELEAEGFTGHLTEISSFCRKKGNAWLNPEGEGGATWEEVPYWFRGFIALGYALDDQRIIKESQPWIENLFATQQADGYFGPPKNRGDEARGPDLMPNMNMLFALRSYYEFTGDRRVLDVMTKYFRWQLTIPDKRFFSGGWQVPRNGDNLDSVYWLYNRTGEPFLLELAAKLQRCGASWMNVVTGGHNVDFSQGFRKPALFYQQNHDPKFLEATEKNWESIMGLYGQVPGGMFGGDEFARPGYTDPRQAIETCGAVEMMISEQMLLRITGDPKWADRCEDVAFNTLPATMTADMKALRYLTSPNQVNSDARSKAPELANAGPMQVMNPHDHRCCQHNAGVGWPCFADSLWCATPGNGLAAVFYAASTVQAKVGNGAKVTIEQQTQYPFDGTVKFTLNADDAVAFPLYLRVPGWCADAAVELNGRTMPVSSRAGAFLCVERTWQPGDTLTLSLPLDIRLTKWERNQNAVSVHRGPLTFSIKIGERYVRYEPQRFADPWPAWEILATTPWNYAIGADTVDPAASFQVVTKAWPANDMPFTHEGTPIELRAQARKLPNWKEDHVGLVDKLQPSPVQSSEPLESVTLIPMGAARLRLAAIPVLGDGPDARQWQLPAEPLTSYSRGIGIDPYEAMFDGKLPKNSNDRGCPRFTTYCFGGAEHGKRHWVQKNFDQETTVSACEVYWYDESQPLGDVRLPKWWRVLYRSGTEWKEVENPSDYGIELDRFNVVTFKPVRTTAVRLDVQCQDERGRWAMGILEWRIK
ncbi:MAG: glycoside hydrolase family 127 protein [Pirellulaceae bacterium]|nr:glycoside hydrolase family 127 protein [Pirellulaceae bacterium]